MNEDDEHWDFCKIGYNEHDTNYDPATKKRFTELLRYHLFDVYVVGYETVFAGNCLIGDEDTHLSNI